MTDRQLLQQALDTLETADESSFWVNQESIVKALRERLAQPEQEPVGKVSDQQCRRLLYGFMLDFNAVGFEQAGRNLHRAMKEAAHGTKEKNT